MAPSQGGDSRGSFSQREANSLARLPEVPEEDPRSSRPQGDWGVPYKCFWGSEACPSRAA